MLSIILLDLTFREVLESLPSDPGSIFALLLVLLYAGVLWWGSRPKRPRPPRARSG